MTLPYIPKLVQWCFPKRIWHFSRKEKSIYLTFDDGPIPKVTPWVLQQLSSYNAKATFFCIGENIKKHPKLFSEIISKGHALGNHTQHHYNCKSTEHLKYINDVSLCEDEIHTALDKEKEAIVTTKKLFRPPYGRLSLRASKTLRKLGYKIVMWDVLSVDYNATLSKEKCLENVLSHTKNGSVIVFHDSLKAENNLRYALPKVLAHYSKKGYAFKAIKD